MKVEVVIPFASDDPYRVKALQTIRDFYRDEFPDWPILYASSSLPFNRAAAVNAAVRASPAEIVVLNDADTLAPAEQIREAVRLAEEAPGFVWAYTLYLRLSRTVTEESRDWRDALTAPAEWGMVGAGSQGASAVRRDWFLNLGGLDERFAGWGYEDLEFNWRADATDTSRRVPGELRHLWHGDRRPDDSPLSADPADVERNYALWKELTGQP